MRPARIALVLALVVPLTACDWLRARSYVFRGTTQYREGQLDDAITSYRKAIELRPNYAPAKRSLEELDEIWGATPPPPDPQ